MGEHAKETAGSDLVRNGLISSIVLMLGVFGWVGNNISGYMIEKLDSNEEAITRVEHKVTQISTKQVDGRVEWNDKAEAAFRGIEKSLKNDARQDIEINGLMHRVASLEKGG